MNPVGEAARQYQAILEHERLIRWATTELASFDRENKHAHDATNRAYAHLLDTMYTPTPSPDKERTHMPQGPLYLLAYAIVFIVLLLILIRIAGLA